MAIVLGITGNIACGKSTVGKYLESLGVPVLDSDAVVHKIYAEDEAVKKALQENFGTLDRKEISKQVFGDSKAAKEKKKLLESIIHPAVEQCFKAWVEEHKQRDIIANLVPLLFEAKLEKRYNYIVCVAAEPEIQKARLKDRRPDLNEKEIQDRINSQMSQKDKIKNSHFVLENSGRIEDTEEQIEDLLTKIRLKNQVK